MARPQTVNHTPPVPPLLAIAGGILAVSTASIFIRFAQEAHAPSLVIAAYRLTLATLVLAIPALTRYRVELRCLSLRSLGLGLLSGLFLALHFATWISSLEYTTVASSVVLVTTSPLWVALLSPIALKEPIKRVVLWGMGLALVGGVIIGLSDSCSLTQTGIACPPLSEFIHGQAFFGDLLALAGAWMAAFYLLIGRRLRGNMSLVPYVFVVYGMAAVVLVAIMFAVGKSPMGYVGSTGVFTNYPASVFIWFLLLALVPQLLGHSTFNWALRYLSAAYISITLLGEPVGSAILAYFILGETPTGFKIFGAILILSGIYIASRNENQ